MQSSPHKVAKKARQVFRKHQAEFFGACLKPKPKWIPFRVYKFLLGLFIKIDN